MLLPDRFRISIAQGTGILLVERLGDLIAIIIMVAGGRTLFVELCGYLAIGLFLVAADWVFCTSGKLRRLIFLPQRGLRSFIVSPTGRSTWATL